MTKPPYPIVLTIAVCVIVLLASIYSLLHPHRDQHPMTFQLSSCWVPIGLDPETTPQSLTFENTDRERFVDVEAYGDEKIRERWAGSVHHFFLQPGASARLDRVEKDGTCYWSTP